LEFKLQLAAITLMFEEQSLFTGAPIRHDLPGIPDSSVLR
jgi:hypothetical protein